MKISLLSPFPRLKQMACPTMKAVQSELRLQLRVLSFFFCSESSLQSACRAVSLPQPAVNKVLGGSEVPALVHRENGTHGSLPPRHRKIWQRRKERTFSDLFSLNLNLSPNLSTGIIKSLFEESYIRHNSMHFQY